MNKFKVGDRVRCIEAEIGLYIKFGMVYTISASGDEYITLEEIDECHSYVHTRFTLVEQAKQRPHKDLIIAWANDPDMEIEVGNNYASWFATEVPSWSPSFNYRIKTKPSQNELEKEAILQEMDKLKERLAKLGTV